MGGYYRPNQYKKKSWPTSHYKPRRMAYSSSMVNQEINTTCYNLRDLANALVYVARAANSSNYSSNAQAIINQIGNMNSNLSRTARTATQDLINVCNIIASKNKYVATSMKNIERQMIADMSVVEKFYNDWR